MYNTTKQPLPCSTEGPSEKNRYTHLGRPRPRPMRRYPAATHLDKWVLLPGPSPAQWWRHFFCAFAGAVQDQNIPSQRKRTTHVLPEYHSRVAFPAPDYPEWGVPFHLHQGEEGSHNVETPEVGSIECFEGRRSCFERTSLETPEKGESHYRKQARISRALARAPRDTSDARAVRPDGV